MSLLFFLLITFSLAMLPFSKRKKPILVLLLLVMALLIVKYPDTGVSAAKSGLDLWLFMVIPSLLPFFIINDMLVALRVPDYLSLLLTPLARFLFNTSGYGAYAFVMSVFSGYPSGARIVSTLVREKKISANEGQRILSFSSTSGPLFIIGVVGIAMLGSPTAGYILLASHISAAILNGMLFRFIGSDRTANLPTEILAQDPASGPNQISMIFADATMKSFKTCVFIGGYVVMFSVINALLGRIQFFTILGRIMENGLHISSRVAQISCSLFEASLEIANGSRILSGMNGSFDLKMILISFILAFSCVSILGQAAGLLHDTGISIGYYVISKLTHGIIASALCWVMLKFSFVHISVFSNAFDTNSYNNFCFDRILMESIVALILTLFFTFILFKREKK